MYTTPQAATDFFRDLRAFTVDVLKSIKAPTSPGGKVRSWKFGRPKGIIEHFTASVSWKGAASWLNDPKNQDSSCHFLVLDRLATDVAPILAKYPSLATLPVTCLLLADLDKGTWHAGWANSMCVGIENRNVGEVRYVNGKFCWWANSWSAPLPKELNKTPVLINGRHWEPYTKGQIKANILIGRALNAMTRADGGLIKSWIIPHSCVSNQKSDTGPAFPLHDVREAMFTDKALSSLDFINKMVDDPIYTRDYDEMVDANFMKQLAESQQDRNVDSDFTNDQFLKAIGTPSASLQMLVQNGDWKGKLDVVRRGLAKLEYYIDPGLASIGSKLDLSTSTAVQMFQRSVGLTADSVPGPVTQKAIYDRMTALGLQPGV